MKEKRKFYQQSWFIMLLLFSPLFPVGLVLMWKEKGMNRVFKIIFTAVYIYAIVFTIQTKDILFTVQKEGITEEKSEQVQTVSEAEKKDNTIMVAYVADHEEQFGEFFHAEPVKEFDKEKHHSVYTVRTSMGAFTFHLSKEEVKLVLDTNGKIVK